MHDCDVLDVSGDGLVALSVSRQRIQPAVHATTFVGPGGLRGGPRRDESREDRKLAITVAERLKSASDPVSNGARTIGHAVRLEKSFACICCAPRSPLQIKRYDVLNGCGAADIAPKVTNGTIACGCDHTSTNAPDPIRTTKLSVLGRE